MEADDVQMIDPPTKRRSRVRRWLRVHVDAALSDYRYPRAVATVLGWTTCLLAVVVTFLGVDRVLDRLATRASYSECVDDREVRFEVALTDLLLSFGAQEPVSDVDVVDLRDELALAADGLRRVDEPLADGGCPGRETP